jgi:hypothetical protein
MIGSKSPTIHWKYLLGVGSPKLETTYH